MGPTVGDFLDSKDHRHLEHSPQRSLNFGLLRHLLADGRDLRSWTSLGFGGGLALSIGMLKRWANMPHIESTEMYRYGSRVAPQVTDISWVEFCFGPLTVDVCHPFIGLKVVGCVLGRMRMLFAASFPRARKLTISY